MKAGVFYWYCRIMGLSFTKRSWHMNKWKSFHQQKKHYIWHLGSTFLPSHSKIILHTISFSHICDQWLQWNCFWSKISFWVSIVALKLFWYLRGFFHCFFSVIGQKHSWTCEYFVCSLAQLLLNVNTSNIMIQKGQVKVLWVRWVAGTLSFT